MVRRMNVPCFCTLILSLMLGPAIASAAPGNGTQEEQNVQAEPGSKSYLPPWMQGPQGTAAKNGAIPEKTVVALDGPEAAKQKAKAAQAQQRRRSHSPSLFSRAFVGIFGR
ncbi:MAG: hypothetical protein HY765_00480 [Rhodomicrobium sp.]|nr:hypothetical protein [Rhodomicrobium sp.]